MLKIVKDGIKRFETLYEVTFNKYVCPSCECEFEIQQSETSRLYVLPKVECPYCGMKHKVDEFKKYEAYRKEWMHLSDVVHFDAAKNPEKIVEVK